jgi:hypothetical protein
MRIVDDLIIPSACSVSSKKKYCSRSVHSPLLTLCSTRDCHDNHGGLLLCNLISDNHLHVTKYEVQDKVRRRRRVQKAFCIHPSLEKDGDSAALLSISNALVMTATLAV